MSVQQLTSTHYRVDSESREGVRYDVHQDGATWTCSCPQNAIKHRLCKHLRATWSFIRDCPACHGKGIIRLSILWYEEDGTRSANELRCIECDGSGRREPKAAPRPDDAGARVDLAAGTCTCREYVERAEGRRIGVMIVTCRHLDEARRKVFA